MITLTQSDSTVNHLNKKDIITMIITDNTITPITENTNTEAVETAEVKTVKTSKPKSKKAYTMITPSTYETMNSVITKKSATLKSLHQLISVIYFDENETLDLKGSKISRKNGVYVIALDEYKGRSIDLNLESDLTMNLKVAKTENAKQLSGKYFLQALALTTAMLRAIRPLTDQREFTVNVKGECDIKISYQSRPEHIALQIASLIGKNDLEVAVVFNSLMNACELDTRVQIEEEKNLKIRVIKNCLDYVK